SFERRVNSTYVCVSEALSLFGEARRVGRPTFALPASLRGGIPVRSRMAAAPDSVAVVAEIVESTGDSTRTEPGVPKGRRRTGRYVTAKMPVFERFEPTLRAPMPERYVIPAKDTAVVRVLRDHGIIVRAASNPIPGVDLVGNGFVFMIDSVVVAPRVFQGHREVRLTGRWRGETRKIEPGSFIVDMLQPLRLLAVYLLEPQSDDGLVTWNFFDSDLRPGGLYPVFKVGGVPPSP
ncbi:MAG: hypothetical protein ACR2GK_13795, partial [Gemmatimonadaceae bacterium]